MTTPFTIRLAGPITDVPRHIHGTPSQLANAGATLAAEHADRLTKGEWQAAAYAFLVGYARNVHAFHCSDVREASRGFVPDHPDLDPRAWGQVVKRAAKAGIIRPLGYSRTERKVSHGRMEQQWQAKA